MKSNERSSNPISHAMLKDFIEKLHRNEDESLKVNQQQFVIDPKTKKIRNQLTQKILRNSESRKRFIKSSQSKCLTYGYGIRNWADCQNGICDMIYDRYMK